MITKNYLPNTLACAIFDVLSENETSYIPNKVYHNKKYNLHWYINRYGYMHILKPIRVTPEECIARYSIRDYLISPHTEKPIKPFALYGVYDNLSDALNVLIRAVKEGHIHIRL